MMPQRYFLVIWALLSTYGVVAKLSLVGECVSTYSHELVRLGFDQKYILALSSIKLKKPLKSQPKKVLVDLGLGSIGQSQVFNHMIQLNITGITQDKEFGSANCRQFKSKDRIEEVSSSLYEHEDYVYISGIDPILPEGKFTWFNLVNSNPSAIVLMNDVTDQEYYNNQYSPACNASIEGLLPPQCYVPFVSIGEKYTKLSDADHMSQYLLSRMPFDQVKQLLAAYRSLVTCSVPPERLFSFNLNKISSSTYWHSLLSVMGITNQISSYNLNNLIDGGVHAPISTYERCTSMPCYNFNSGPRGVTPSVCDDPTHHLPGAVANRMATCAAHYAESVSNIFGQEYYWMMYNRLLAAPNFIRRDPIDTRRLILSVGPGTTGTSSIFAAMTQLNITGRHYGAYSLNCADGVVLREEFQFDLRILDSESKNRPIFWGDTPVPERWWHIMRMYPLTKIIMTDVRVAEMAAWLKKRRMFHCYRVIRRNWDPCTIPLPFTFSVGGSNLSVSLYNKVHIQRVNVDQATRAFEAYRQLIRCAVPPEQLLWIFIKEQESAEIFWNKLINFTNVSISEKVRSRLIAEGIPHVGSKGCFLNGQPCRYVDRANNSAIIPSVCSIAQGIP